MSLWASAAYAQTHSNDAARLFDIAAAKHKRELWDLWGTRDIPRIRLPDASSASIARALSVRADASRVAWGDYGELTYPDGTAVLFYSYGEKNLQVWLVTALGIQAYHKQSISKQQLGEAITSLRDSLNVDSLQRARMPRQPGGNGGSPVATSAKPPRDRAIADLTQILLPAPVADQLDGVNHLIIVPVLEIGTVPYAILKPFRDNSFLIDRMSISIASSLFDLEQTLQKKRVNQFFKFPLVVGNPYLPKSRWVIPSLPGAEQEAQAVAKMMKAVPLLGRDATKARIVSAAKYASFLYFAAHGIASSQNPLSESFLMLSADSFEQGWWTAREIQSTRLRAEIAVLSACQTGLGQAHDAGIIGLARAFQLAGVARVVMSLWSVDDQATSQLMQAFVKRLDNHFPSEALRQAMLEVRTKHSEPSKWASFVIFGTPR